MFYSLRISICCLAMFVCAGLAPTTFADVAVLKENTEDKSVGDFNCSSGQYQPRTIFEIAAGRDYITAGELWTHFKSKGVESMNQLVLGMDLDPELNRDDVDVQQIELKIENPFDRATLTSFSLDRDGVDHSLVIPSYEASAYYSEAQMKIDLGFDFMKTFSEDSTQKIYLNVTTNGYASTRPRLYFASDESDVSIFPVTLKVGLFIGFWVVVFLLLFRFTNPESRSGSESSQAMSTS